LGKEIAGDEEETTGYIRQPSPEDTTIGLLVCFRVMEEIDSCGKGI